MQKIDLAKIYKSYYSAAAQPYLDTFEKVAYLSILGKGDPSGEGFSGCIQALYATAYALKFQYKAAGQDFVVPKLEGLWWFDEQRFPNQTIHTAPTQVPRSEWEFRLLIRLPDFVQPESLKTAAQTAVTKKNIVLAASVEWLALEEGLCVQMMHTGPFANEPDSLKIMAAFMEEHKLGKNGLHHEIYLSDFRTTAPEKLKTILREPVWRMDS